ncbi:CRISPR-associated protein Cas4 [Sporanaerobacter sp. PP17-6a]|uniref:CRISPR-associated protein Cas4 n=1 Tax=Sporanaerobacter sp. PP17-6a TaxID=1891289 RepID=UPI0008A03DBE|nr:CRISPR-associated protein Cas4 [Sporanaerobacter sp. PP17-6a]SCL81400.1 CRISPR-associated protein Cas4 [Sporanaerobacter sp. PP17-6a]
MKNITGVMVYYYFVCKRKLWYFNKEINMEFNSELVGMGKLIDENSYGREKKSILIDETINIDFLKDWKIIHEIKKSKKIDVASKWQLKYYIWILRNKGVDIEKGVLDYPLLRKREDIFLTKKEEEGLLHVLDDIQNIIAMDLPPEIINKKTCKKCAYYEICFI